LGQSSSSHQSSLLRASILVAAVASHPPLSGHMTFIPNTTRGQVHLIPDDSNRCDSGYLDSIYCSITNLYLQDSITVILTKIRENAQSDQAAANKISDHGHNNVDQHQPFSFVVTEWYHQKKESCLVGKRSKKLRKMDGVFVRNLGCLMA
jgi:hypothetical protein